MLDLKRKVAFVTGGASGIGEACSLMLANQGAAIAVVDLNLDAAQSIADQINSKGGKAIALTADVSDEAQVAKAVNDTVASAVTSKM